MYLIIIGCGRSGTKYTSELLKACGYDVGHEQAGKSGIVSWPLTQFTSPCVYGPNYFELKNKYKNIIVLHQVRHPLKVINSCLGIKRTSWEYISKFITIKSNMSKLEKAMYYWYWWNKLAEKNAMFMYQVEKIDEFFGNLSFIKFNYNIEIPKDINTRGNPNKYGWDDLNNVNEKLTEAIKIMAMGYGYGIE